MALYEDIQYNEKGILRNNSFMQYKIPTRQDFGQIRVDFRCSYEKSGPFGATSIGELVIDTPCRPLPMRFITPRESECGSCPSLQKRSLGNSGKRIGELIWHGSKRVLAFYGVVLVPAGVGGCFTRKKTGLYFGRKLFNGICSCVRHVRSADSSLAFWPARLCMC